MEKKNIDWSSLGFGYIKTDYRFVSNYKDGAWDDGVMTEDAEVKISECAGVLQYAQTCFEGMKAYTTEDGRTVVFRPDLNAERMANSARRLEMPAFPEDRFVDAVLKTVKANEAYVPPFGSGATLYIRPYMFGSDPVIGVKPSNEYQFRIFTTPVGPYFKGGAKPITIKVSDFTKDNKVVTPKSSSILPSITRRSLITVAKDYLGLEVEEREVEFSEVADFAECGLCGTAAVISPVGKIYDHGREIAFPSGMEEMGPITKKLYETLTGIQMGRIEAPEGWIRVIE